MKTPFCIDINSSWSQQILFLFPAVVVTLGKPLNLSVAHIGNEKCHQMVTIFLFNSQVLNFSPFFSPPLFPNCHCPYPCHQHCHPLKYSPVERCFSNFNVHPNNQKNLLKHRF